MNNKIHIYRPTSNNLQLHVAEKLVFHFIDAGFLSRLSQQINIIILLYRGSKSSHRFVNVTETFRNPNQIRSVAAPLIDLKQRLPPPPPPHRVVIPGSSPLKGDCDCYKTGNEPFLFSFCLLSICPAVGLLAEKHPRIEADQ